MRNVHIAALSAQLLLGTAYAAPRPLSQKKSGPALNQIAARDGCGVTTYTVITPKPGMQPTPVTKQFQPVYSCIPQYVVCDSSGNNKCETAYSTTSYKWVSTAVPCYNGMCTVTDVGQAVTVAAYPTYAVATGHCDSPGPCYYGDYSTNVPQPTSFAYVNPGMNYYVCPFTDYYKYYSGGLGQLNVDVYSCINGVCRVYPLGLVTKTYLSTDTYQVPYEINSYFPYPTTVVIGDLDITINISFAPTSVSTVLTGTSTVTRTVTTTETTTISDGVTITETTTGTDGAPAPTATDGTDNGAAEETFVLGADVNIFAKNKRQQTARSFAVCSNGICALQQNCTNAALFTLDQFDRLVAGSGFIYATVNDITSGAGPLKVGNGPVSRGFSINGGIVSWINAAFVQGDHEARFCQNRDNSITVIFPGGETPEDCTPFTFIRVNPDNDLACLGVNGRPISRSSTTSSASSTQTSSTNSGSSTIDSTQTGTGTGSDASNTSSASSSSTGAGNTATTTDNGNTATITDDATTSTNGATTGPTNTGTSGPTVIVTDTEPLPTTQGPTATNADTATGTTDTSTATSSIGGNANLEVCNSLLPALKAICISLNGVDPCSLEALVDGASLLRCTDNGGTLPANLVSCVSSPDPIACILSCSGLLDTLLLVNTCQASGGSPAAALLDCNNFVLTVGGLEVTTLADLCVSLDGQNPCSADSLLSLDPVDILSFIPNCVLGGFLDTLVSTCLLTAFTDTAKIACLS